LAVAVAVAVVVAAAGADPRPLLYVRTSPPARRPNLYFLCPSGEGGSNLETKLFKNYILFFVPKKKKKKKKKKKWAECAREGRKKRNAMRTPHRLPQRLIPIRM
jgi:hypothetical protein